MLLLLLLLLPRYPHIMFRGVIYLLIFVLPIVVIKQSVIVLSLYMFLCVCVYVHMCVYI